MGSSRLVGRYSRARAFQPHQGLVGEDRGQGRRQGRSRHSRQEHLQPERYSGRVGRQGQGGEQVDHEGARRREEVATNGARRVEIEVVDKVKRNDTERVKPL